MAQSTHLINTGKVSCGSEYSLNQSRKRILWLKALIESIQETYPVAQSCHLINTGNVSCGSKRLSINSLYALPNIIIMNVSLRKITSRHPVNYVRNLFQTKVLTGIKQQMRNDRNKRTTNRTMVYWQEQADHKQGSGVLTGTGGPQTGQWCTDMNRRTTNRAVEY